MIMTNNMTFFFIIIIAGVIGFLEVFQVSHKYSKYGIVFSLIFICTFYRFGQDTEAYVNLYREVPKLVSLYDFYKYLLDSRYEPGFLILIGFLKSAGFNFYFFFFIVSLFSVSVLIFIANQFKEFFYLSCFWYVGTYYVWNEHVQIRQGVSTSFFLLALFFLIRKKTFRVFELLLLSFVFHFASLIYFVGFFLEKKINKRSGYILLLLFSLLISLIGSKNIILYIDRFALVMIPSTVIDYILLSNYAFELKWLTLKNLKIFLISSLIFYYWEELKKNQLVFVMCKFFLIGVSFQLIFRDFYLASVRFSQFFHIVECFIIAYMAKKMFKNKAVYIVGIGVCYYLTKLFL